MVNRLRAWDQEKGIMYGPEVLDLLLHFDGRMNSHEEGCLMGENYTKQLPVMLPTGLPDKHGEELWQGDIVKMPVTVNQEFHGDYALYEIIRVHGQWIISYLRSEKGALLPRGYLRAFLLTEYDYDTKLFLWSEDYKPRTELERVGDIYRNPELTEEYILASERKKAGGE